eukprot:Nk52_evm1s2247 gene=Nk52_evmTU1s2247
MVALQRRRRLLGAALVIVIFLLLVYSKQLNQAEYSVPLGAIEPVDLRHMCSGHGVLKKGECHCYTKEWSGTTCSIHVPMLPNVTGSQVNMLGVPRCLAKPDADPDLISAAVSWICKNYSGYCHDLFDRTGVLSWSNPYLKSTYAFSYCKSLKNNTEKCIRCDKIRGRLNGEGDFVQNLNDPPLAEVGLKTGPAIFPPITLENAGPLLCPAGEECCIARAYNNSQRVFSTSWGASAIALQRLCSPKYELKCPTEMYNKDCGDGSAKKWKGEKRDSSNKRILKCNCLKVKKDFKRHLFSGDGVDCSLFLPGGKYQNSWDMYRMLSYAANENFKKTGNCTTNYSPLYVTKCVNDSKHEKCKIPQVLGLWTDWRDFWIGGYP